MASSPGFAMEDEGLQIVLTPVQLAKIFAGENMSEGEMLSTRLWGGAQALFGIIEAVGAGALLLTPEPTMLTKAGGMALGASALDQIQAGARQLWTGRRAETVTYEATRRAASGLGATPEMAANVGRTFDIAVPVALSAGLGAARIMAIRSGRITLIEHEAIAGSRVGGHTILEHVGKTDAELLQRLSRPARRPPAMVSTFASLEVAERAVSQVLRGNQAAIRAWAKTASPGARQAFGTGFPGAGRGIARGTTQAIPLNSVRVVLKKEAFNGKLYYVLTAFPVP